MSANRIQILPSEGIGNRPTDITGFDGINGGGLPRRWSALVCREAACAKKFLASEIIMPVISPLFHQAAWSDGCHREANR